MTRKEAVKILWQYDVNFEPHPTEDVMHAIDMAIEALEQIESGRYIKGECSICSKEYGTLGCCSTVSNHWVYSCKEGMAQYAEALEQEPSCRNTRQVDLISRQDAIDGLEYEKEMLNRALDNMDIVVQEREKFAWGLGLVECFIEDIKELPSKEIINTKSVFNLSKDAERGDEE